MSLNLCCISLLLKEQGFSFQTLTWKRFNELGRDEGLKILSDRILNNAKVTQRTIEYCADNNWGYRLSSTLFPLISFDEANIELEQLKDYNEIIQILSKSGEIARNNAVRLSSHPGEYTTLDSDNPVAISRSVRDLELHGFLHDALGLSKDYSNPINIHLKNEHISFIDHKNRIKDSICRLSDSVKNRLVLENNDKGRWNCNTLADKYADSFPLTYDNLHDKVNHSSDSNSNIRIFAQSWGKYKPLFHYSEGREDNKRAHRDYPQDSVSFFSSERTNIADYDVELKMKDFALNMMTPHWYALMRWAARKSA